MPFSQTIQPQFRDSDSDGLVGLRGCLRYFQDIHTWYLHAMDKGNDVVPERYGTAWIYTRYRMRLYQKLDYTDSATLTTWMEPYRQPVLVKQNLIVAQHGRTVAEGKLETCLFSLARQRPVRLSAIEFPDGVPEDIPNAIPDFLPVEKTAGGMTERYRHTVRVADIDRNRHMNNLRYIELFQNAYSSDFWRSFAPAEVQINFLSQSREGETLTVLAREDGNTIRMAAVHGDGRLAAMAVFIGNGEKP